MEQNLEPVEFSILDGVAAQVDLCEERQVFNIGQLPSLADVVKLDFEEPQAIGVLETL